ncbi:hypothetical protein EUGRSUZ_H01853 [Eucalyptus grandis]|uniref:Uncharacterized protein n=2 Tax=Eucalyptus grandis TaxID=71139 RepID=A0ACC3LZD8_EUCGR|nr:hypothetical protein EUGRSUZ_H01853 [Eucalyptus grandis]
MGAHPKDQGVTIPKLPTSPFSSRTTLLIKRVRSISNPFDRIGFTDQSPGENSANCSCTPDTIARDKAFDGGAKSQIPGLRNNSANASCTHDTIAKDKALRFMAQSNLFKRRRRRRRS